jgi:DNA repair exonuclease SbcCD ATPase subunit
MDYVILAITVVISIGIAAFAFLVGRRSGFQASDDVITSLSEESRQLESRLIETLGDNDALVSRGQLEALKQRTTGFLDALSEQRQQLQSITDKLDKIREDVERRETEQQELRALKQEDEVAIDATLASYNESLDESLTLEQRLAESLRSLDKMSGEVKMTADQKALFQELSNGLTQTSAELRDVIVDYQAANERLSNLRTRFLDLEREYSKLVEQQLAG